MDQTSDYELLDSGGGRKLERFGPHVLIRPCAPAVWRPQRAESAWRGAEVTFDREQGNRWHNRGRLPDDWVITVDGLRFQLSGTDFGHVGIFPEQRALWQWIDALTRQACKARPGGVSVLNLFAYSGGSTLAAARAGAAVCHLDASKGMVQWARENAALNQLQAAPVRWIVDDALKFLKREKQRERRYDAIILDPPSFGRGANGEVFKIEEHMPELLAACGQLLSDQPVFMLLSSHTPGFSPLVLENLLRQTLAGLDGCFAHGEMLLTGGADVFALPNGTYARWELPPR